jgi:Carboxypeptidase regulatory-like domain
MRHSIKARRWLLASCLVGGCIPQPGWAQGNPLSNGAIQGTVVSDSGAPLVGAAVTLLPFGSSSKFSGSVVSSGAGAFGMTAIPAGRYLLCARSSTPTYVDSCLWGIPRILVDVPRPSGSRPIVIPLKKASLLKARLNDSGVFLKPLPSEKFPPHVLLGVWGASQFIPAHEVKKDVTGIDYELPVPSDTPLRLRVYSRYVKLTMGGTSSPVDPKGYTTVVFFDSHKPPAPPLALAAVGRQP